MSEILGRVIKSCCANFGVQWQVFFLFKSILQKLILGKDFKFWEKCWPIHQVCTATESDYLFGEHAYFLGKCDFLCKGLYTLKNVSNSDRNFNFSYDMLICTHVKVFHLLKIGYSDWKYHFFAMIFWAKV